MTVAGFNLQKSQIRLVVLDGTKEHPQLIDSQKLVNHGSADLPSLMNWYEDSFSRILEQHNIDLVAYRFSLISNSTMEQVQNLYYPYGVLNSLCFHHNIQSIEFSSRKLKNPKTIGHPKGADIYALCDSHIGDLCAKDKPQKDSALVAWFALEG